MHKKTLRPASFEFSLGFCLFFSKTQCLVPWSHPWVSAGLDLIVSKRNLTSAKQGVDAGRELGAEAEWGRNFEFPARFPGGKFLLGICPPVEISRFCFKPS